MCAKRVVDTADALVVALCADYERRKRALSEGVLPHATEMEYKYLNYKIFDAAAETVGERVAELYVTEIGERTGYAASEIGAVSETTYKLHKSRVKAAIARKLHLSF